MLQKYFVKCFTLQEAADRPKCEGSLTLHYGFSAENRWSVMVLKCTQMLVRPNVLANDVSSRQTSQLGLLIQSCQAVGPVAQSVALACTNSKRGSTAATTVI